MEFCKKKEENCLAPYCKEREIGNVYTYLAHKRETDFFVCFKTGKWNEQTCDEFYELLSKKLRFPTKKRRLDIFSDGNKQNFTAIINHFSKNSINYGIRKKVKIDGKIVGVVNKIIYGNISKDEIRINHIDGFCSKLRERISCFTRKARSFAKRKATLDDRLEIFSVQHNFIEKKLGKTPAMKEGLISKPITWEIFFHRRLSILN